MTAINFDQLWYVEDQSEDALPSFDVKPKKPVKKNSNPIQDWANALGHRIGDFEIKPHRQMIVDMTGEYVMPILPAFIGAPEALVLQEIYAHLNMEEGE